MKLEVHNLGELRRMFVSYVQRFKLQKKEEKMSSKLQTKISQSFVIVAIMKQLFSEYDLGRFVENH